jgi:tetratricopeptide (TPR) repeat protein
MRSALRSVVFSLLVLGLLSGVARADVLLLKDGRIVDGPKMEWGETGVTIHFVNGDVVVPEDDIEEAIIPGGQRPFVPQTPEEKEKVEKGLVRYEGKWITPERREALLARRLEEKAQEIEEVKQRSLWRNKWQEETKHFKFQSTLPPHITEYFCSMMEAYYTEFGKVWKVKQPRDLGKLSVCFHVNREKFHQVSGAPGGALGYFKFVPPLDLNFFYDRIDPRYTEEVMFHEANHYLQLLIDPTFSMPHFPGEAIAEYYGASTYDPVKKKLTVGLMQEGRLAGMKNEIDAGEMLPLKKMLETSRMYEHYSWGWSLVHFLMGDRRYRKKFEKWVLALPRAGDIKRVPSGNPGISTVEGAEVLKSFMRYLGIKSEAKLAELEKEWHTYVRDQLDFVSGRGIEMAAKAARRAGRPIRATRLFKEAIATGEAGANAYNALAELLEYKERPEAIKLWKKAIELDPLEGAYYASLARVTYDDGQEEEGRRMAKLAMELSPEDMWLADRVREIVRD